MPAPDATSTLDLDAPLELVASLGPLVRGRGDRTIRLARDRAWWATRTPDGPATVGIRHIDHRRLAAEAWGPGAAAAIGRLPRLFGPATGTLGDVDDARIARLSRHRPGVRILRTGAVLDALIAAILEQKVTGTEAHRAWHGLVRRYGEPAPGPPELGLRLLPSSSILAGLPYWAFHPLGVERRRAELIRAVARDGAAIERLADVPLPAAYVILRMQ